MKRDDLPPSEEGARDTAAGKKEGPGEGAQMEITPVETTIYINAKSESCKPIQCDYRLPVISNGFHGETIDGIPKNSFCVEDLARSGLIPSDFPFGVQVLPPNDKGQAEYRINYTVEYYKVRIDTLDKNKYRALKGEAIPVVFFGDFHGVPIVATIEGYKKALLFHITTGIPTIAIDSCWHFGESIGDDDTELSRVLRSEIIHRITPGQGHLVGIDGDWKTNANVKRALGTYSVLLEEFGAKVQCLDFGTSPDGKKWGYDDWFVTAHGVDRLAWPTQRETLKRVGMLPRVPPTELSLCFADALASDERFSNSLLDLTERGFGSLLIKYYGKENIRFNTDTDEWLFWKDNRWTRKPRDTSSIVNPAARFLGRRQAALSSQINKLIQQIASLSDDSPDEVREALNNKKSSLKDEVASLARWITSLSSAAGRGNVLKDMYQRTDLHVRENQFDADPFILACQNGIVDLRTGTLRGEIQEDYITQRCPIDFPLTRPKGENVRRIRKLLLEITGSWDPRTRSIVLNPKKLRYLQKRLGAALIGLNALTSIEFLTGIGANGKSVLSNLIQAALGDIDEGGYAAATEASVLMTTMRARDGESASPMLLRLLKARIVLAAENNDTAHLNEALVKQLTGGDKVTVRGLYQGAVSIRPKFTACLLTNFLPQLNSAGPAMIDRIAITTFDVRWRRPELTFWPEEEKHFPLGDAWLVNEAHLDKDVASYVLWWLIQGCMRWKRDGLGEAPATSVSATNDYLTANDKFASWMYDHKLILAEGRIKASDAHRFFTNWLINEGQKGWSAQLFYSRLLEKYPQLVKKKSNGENWIVGLRWMTDEEKQAVAKVE